MQLDVHEALLLPPGGGETITERRARTVLLTLDTPQLVMTWTRYESGQRGPEPHVHHQHADGFYVLEGELEFLLGPGAAHVVRAPAGSVVVAPPNLVHTFANTSSERALYLNFHAPNGGFAEFMRAMRDGRSYEWDSWDPPEDGGRPVSDGIVCLPGGGERFDRGNRTVTILAELPELSLMELAVTPDWEGVDPHHHVDHLDAFVVLDGEIEFLVGLGPEGTLVAAPPGAAHGLARPQAPARLLNVHAPDAGFAGRIRAQ